MKDIVMTAETVMQQLGLGAADLTGGSIRVTSPIDGRVLGEVHETPLSEMAAVLDRAKSAFKIWRSVPAPRRGELIRLLGEELRASKEALGALVSWEAGKITSEGLGEVQEMIDICDFAVGLSRQLYGLTIASERPGHRMMETWHPAGPVGVISAFNFPVAVWSWNAALAIVCGDPVIWKPSEKTPLTALACQKIFERALARFGDAPDGLLQTLIGGADLGRTLVESEDVPIISATGSTRMGRAVAPIVAARFGKCILELGGNNAMIVGPSADLEMAVRAIVFSAVGTAGQRCTTLRRLIAHNSIKDELVARLKKAYAGLPIGNPLAEGTLIGPLVDEASGNAMTDALKSAKAEGGMVFGGARVSEGVPAGGVYMQPAIVEMPAQSATVKTETFAPILYVMGYDSFEEAVHIQNDVPQGLSSCVFTLNMREAEQFLSASGSDCGIANVNIGPSGAETVGRLAARRKPAVVAKAARTRGKPICAGRPTR